MATRECVGCGEILTKGVRSKEHILPRWLARQVSDPNLQLKHFRRDSANHADELLRSHDLSTFVIKNVCVNCNNGWMSRLEECVKPLLSGLMTMQASILQLLPEDRRVLSAWVIKTAFMIASAQESAAQLPWHLFRGLAELDKAIPAECLVVAAQFPFLPKGFLYSCPGDILPQYLHPVQMRVGFTLHQFHCVVLLPVLSAKRELSTSGLHVPIWPLDLKIVAHYDFFPSITNPPDLINYLTNVVRVAILEDTEVREDRSVPYSRGLIT
jgi:hypothetical protein